MTAWLVALENAKVIKKKKSKQSALEIAERFIQKTPGKADLLRELAGRFENKTFLSQMREVRHFLVPFGIDPKSLKSRNDSARKVFERLSELPSSELQAFISHPTSGDSAFSDLAKAIIGDHRRSDSSS